MCVLTRGITDGVAPYIHIVPSGSVCAYRYLHTQAERYRMSAWRLRRRAGGPFEEEPNAHGPALGRRTRARLATACTRARNDVAPALFLRSRYYARTYILPRRLIRRTRCTTELIYIYTMICCAELFIQFFFLFFAVFRRVFE